MTPASIVRALLLVAALLAAAVAAGARGDEPALQAFPSAAAAPAPVEGGRVEGAPTPAVGPDVELHVPRAEVQKVSLEIENLEAKLDLDTGVANLVRIRAGVTATVEKLKLQLEGVQTEARLVVRLERVAGVLEQALDAIDRAPGLGATIAPARPVFVPPPAQAPPPLPLPLPEVVRPPGQAPPPLPLPEVIPAPPRPAAPASQE